MEKQMVGLIAIVLLFTSCNYVPKDKYDRVVAERDSSIKSDAKHLIELSQTQSALLDTTMKLDSLRRKVKVQELLQDAGNINTQLRDLKRKLSK